LLAAFVLALAAPTAHAADAEKKTAPRDIPFADFARHAQFRDIKISPDGETLAASAVVDGKAVLSLVRLADMKGVNVRPRDRAEIADFWWVSPQRVFYSIAERMSALEQPVLTGELFGVDADGTKRLELGYRASKERAFVDAVRPAVAIDGKMLVSKSNWNGSADGAFPTAGLLDVYNGSFSPLAVAPIKNARFLADHAGVVRFAFSTGTDQHRRLYYRSGNGASWELVADAAHDEPVAPIGFARDDASVYVECAGKSGTAGLCRWNTKTRASDALWSGASDLVSLVPTFDRKDYVAIRSMPDRAATTLLDRNAPESVLLASLLRQFPGEDVDITSSTSDGAKVVFLVSSDRNPGEFYRYDRATKKASLLFAREPWIDAKAMAAMEPIAFPARDGLPLHGYLTKPLGAENEKSLPLVVFVHGGPYGVRDDWAFDPTVQMLASRGYAVLQVNFRGSGGYGAAFQRAGYREWGGKMQDDVTDATRWAIAQGIADPKRIGIFGGSYGGYAALDGATREPDLYRCAIGYAGVYDLRLMYTRGDIPQSTFGENYLKTVLGEDESVLWDRSPLAHVDRLKAKVMLVVGGEDVRVPPIQGEHLHDALDRAHVAHEWIYQRTEGHGFYDEGNRAELFAKLSAFLDSNIGSAVSQ
jgi:dipeptidyl aminopeptidase/acylaminoacyl peptidase